MHSVNIIVIKENAVVELLAYPDTTEGNFKAGSVFVAMINKYNPNEKYTEEDIDSFLDEGICEFNPEKENLERGGFSSRDNHSVCITHSMNEEDCH
jgi:hypothetical protein